MKRILTLFLLSLMISNIAIADGPILKGGMIQLMNPQMPTHWSCDQRQRDILNLGVLADHLHQDLQMDTIILQNLSYDGTRFVPDPTHIPCPLLPDNGIKDLAIELLAKPFMKVYLGLDYSNNVNKESLRTTTYTETQIVQWFRHQSTVDTALASTIKSLYPSFYGWYIATEIPNYSSAWGANVLDALNQYIKDVSHTCSQLGPSEVAISCYFNPVHSSPQEFVTLLQHVLKDSAVTTLVIQDGFGQHRIDDHWGDTAKTFFVEIIKAFPDKNIIADLEIYDDIGGEDIVTDPENLLKQLCVQQNVLKQVTPQKAYSCIVFDLHNYMNPIMGDENTESGPAAKGDADSRRALYSAYQKAYQQPGFPCTTQLFEESNSFSGDDCLW